MAVGEQLIRTDERTLALWEIVSVVVSCLIAEWVVLAFVGRSKLVLAIPIALALVLMVLSQRAYGETWHEIGFRWDNFLAAVKLLVLLTLAAIVIVVLISKNWSPRDPLRWRFLLVPLWALFQQYVLQGYINRRAQIVLDRGWKSVLLVGLLFAVVHLPNPVLLGFRLSEAQSGPSVIYAFPTFSRSRALTHSPLSPSRFSSRRSGLTACAWDSSTLVSAFTR